MPLGHAHLKRVRPGPTENGGGVLGVLLKQERMRPAEKSRPSVTPQRLQILRVNEEGEETGTRDTRGAQPEPRDGDPA